MMAGIAVGIATLAVLSSIGESTRRETLKRLRNMLGTTDTIIVRPGGSTRGMVSVASTPPTLKPEDANAIASVAGVKQVAMLINGFNIDLAYRGKHAVTGVFGVSRNWLELRGDQMGSGSFFTDLEELGLARVAVIGEDVRVALFPDEDPRGKTIRINDVPFEVIGILGVRGAGPSGGSLDNVVLIPLSTAKRRLFNRDFLTMIIAQLDDPLQSDAVTASITLLLRNRHHLDPVSLADFNVTNPRAVMARLSRIGSTLAKVLVGAALIVLLISGVVIASLMTLGVAERRREIGLRRAVGARRADIRTQFLLECLILSGWGGVLGTTVGLVGANLAAAWQRLPLMFSWSVLILSAAVSIAIGLISGLLPAWRAARVDPVEALRG
jgi:ABC-type antimicrobial peptide transport system permease subunit